jgi:ATP-dependent RNA helicase RhlE
MKFEKYNFSPNIKRSLSETGFIKPTDIQYKAIPPILKGEDVLAIAQTGTGKTAAFAIPIIHLLQERKERGCAEGIKCLVMAPTRELALQISLVFEQLGHYTDINTGCIFGGVDQSAQVYQLNEGIDVLISTPGRLFDLVNQQHLYLDKVEILVLDEADHMLDLGFIKDIQDLIKFLPRKRQTLFFSATIDTEIKKLAYSLVDNPIRIQISPKDPVAKNVTHSVAFIEMDDKRFFLERLINENPESKILVFVRTKVRAERVCKALGRAGLKSITLHGDKDQLDRLEVMDAFRSGASKVLVATDVSSRGIDIPNVEFVVNYDLPEQSENYVHRVGRTGRGTKKGIAVSFCSPEEKVILKEIEGFLDKEITVMEIKKDDYAATLDFSDAGPSDWRRLIKDAEKHPFKTKKKKSKK